MATIKDLTKKQVANLKQLSAYLKQGELKARFNMAAYAEYLGDNIATTCGTVGCAAGHGPYAGIPKRKTEDWHEYSNRVFSRNNKDIWNWLFNEEWTYVDNTAMGAAERIDYFLENGTPTYASILAMQWGDLPLIYKTQHNEN